MLNLFTCGGETWEMSHERVLTCNLIFPEIHIVYGGYSNDKPEEMQATNQIVMIPLKINCIFGTPISSSS